MLAGPGCAVFKCHLVALGTRWEIGCQGIFGVSVVGWARLSEGLVGTLGLSGFATREQLQAALKGNINS